MTKTLEPVIAPYEFACVYALAIHGPLSGGEITQLWPVRQFEWLPRVAGGKLARIARRTGLVERVDGIWRLTDRGRDWLGEGLA